jgi:hypothetical protein
MEIESQSASQNGGLVPLSGPRCSEIVRTIAAEFSSEREKSLSGGTDWRMAQSVANHSLWSKFPDLQGKYREIRRFLCGSDVQPVRNRSCHRCFFSEFPRIWNRELFSKSREVSDDIRESSRNIRVAAHRAK